MFLYLCSSNKSAGMNAFHVSLLSKLREVFELFVSYCVPFDWHRVRSVYEQYDCSCLSNRKKRTDERRKIHLPEADKNVRKLHNCNLKQIVSSHRHAKCS